MLSLKEFWFLDNLYHKLQVKFVANFVCDIRRLATPSDWTWILQTCCALSLHVVRSVQLLSQNLQVKSYHMKRFSEPRKLGRYKTLAQLHRSKQKRNMFWMVVCLYTCLSTKECVSWIHTQSYVPNVSISGIIILLRLVYFMFYKTTINRKSAKFVTNGLL